MIKANFYMSVQIMVISNTLIIFLLMAIINKLIGKDVQSQKLMAFLYLWNNCLNINGH